MNSTLGRVQDTNEEESIAWINLIEYISALSLLANDLSMKCRNVQSVDDLDCRIENLHTYLHKISYIQGAISHMEQLKKKGNIK